ncbi:hypothetical protein NM208_g11840 [Fusarium decemcellulare]|uniref:Uncharacterized protein n=1 Tax=Fusarium decemcellulare TaxID=57161 RepID=A0ACC1RTL0_9HYPO|nr:hypothetical protein NM208_g11840 [Fusarium decemcellulare]
MLSSVRRIFRKKKASKDVKPEIPLIQGPSQPPPPARPAKSFFYSGIKLLHSSKCDDIDIVFIHGLMGDCERTWIAKTATEPWPKALLPLELPTARILTYGYEATAMDRHEVTSQNRVWDHAFNLLTSLALHREGDDTNERPIIFVCHSLGGLVCQDALITALQRPEPHLQNILLRTRGIIFLGTPHHGSSLAKWGELLSRSVGVMRQTNTEIIQVLTRDSEVLARIQDSFHSLVRSREKEETDVIEITCFYEELPMKKLGIIVPKHSAILPGYSSVGIHRNHAEITKFASPDEPGFVAICGELKRWVKKIQQGPTAPRRQDKQDNAATAHCKSRMFISNPDFVGRCDIIDMLKDQLGHNDLESSSKVHRRASLYGLGGVGKTQIALAYAYWLRETCPDTSIFWVHASGSERFTEGYAKIAKECRIPGFDESDNDGLSVIKDWLESKESGKWLMVIDNADDLQLFFPQPDKPSDSSSSATEKLTQYIPDCAHGTVLITTRNMQVGSRLRKGKLPIEVNKMNDNEAIQLLSQGIGGTDESPEELLRLSSRLESLPLALVQAAAFIQENTITVDEYLKLLEGSEGGIVDLLSEEFETVGRESDTPRAVAETWILSFQQIERQYPFAGELLSLMSLFDRQAIPIDFLEFFAEEKKDMEPKIAIHLVKALGVLKAFCFIRAEKTGDHNMHRLVQLVTRTWLIRNKTMRKFSEAALQTVSHFYPEGDFEDIPKCSAYLSHAFSVLKLNDTDSERDRLARALLLYRIGTYFFFQGRFPDAERVQREATSIRTELLGDEHPETLKASMALARCIIYEERLEEAERLQVRTLEMWKRVGGEEHPMTLDSMSNLAVTLSYMGRVEEAEGLNIRVLEASKRLHGEEHPETLLSMGNLAMTIQKLGRVDEAVELQRKALEIEKKVLGEKHPEVLMSMENLASFLEDPDYIKGEGETLDAEELRTCVMETRKEVLGEEHPDTLYSMCALATKWILLGKRSADDRHLYPDVDVLGDALVLLQDCLPIQRQVLGPEHEDTRETCNLLEECQRVIELIRIADENGQKEVGLGWDLYDD